MNIPPADYNHELNLMPVADNDMVRKCHVGSTRKRSLCGRAGAQAGGSLGFVNLAWLNQPDPEEKICKTCKRIALELLK